MIRKAFLYHLAFTFLMSSLRGGLSSFCGTWLRCNSLEWGASKRCTRGPAKQGSGSVGDAATTLWRRIPLRGRTFLRKALLRPSRSHHSASLRLALHPKTAHSTRPTTGFRIKQERQDNLPLLFYISQFPIQPIARYESVLT